MGICLISFHTKVLKVLNSERVSALKILRWQLNRAAREVPKGSISSSRRNLCDTSITHMFLKQCMLAELAGCFVAGLLA